MIRNWIQKKHNKKCFNERFDEHMSWADNEIQPFRTCNRCDAFYETVGK